MEYEYLHSGRKERKFERNGVRYWAVKSWKRIPGYKVRHALRLYKIGEFIPVKKWVWSTDEHGNVED